MSENLVRRYFALPAQDPFTAAADFIERLPKRDWAWASVFLEAPHQMRLDNVSNSTGYLIDAEGVRIAGGWRDDRVEISPDPRNADFENFLIYGQRARFLKVGLRMPDEGSFSWRSAKFLVGSFLRQSYAGVLTFSHENFNGATTPSPAECKVIVPPARPTGVTVGWYQKHGLRGYPMIGPHIFIGWNTEQNLGEPLIRDTLELCAKLKEVPEPTRSAA